jgi:ribosomal protein S18 acetylase RimI-like enzyme
MTAHTVTIDSAVPGDAEAISRVHTKSWQQGYRGIFADEYLDGLDWRDRLPFWTNELGVPPRGHVHLVARRGDALLGFTAAGPARDDDLPPLFGEVHSIYVDPDAWSLGIGKALLGEAVRKLSGMGPRMPGVSLWVFEGNLRARSFYESYGFCADGTVLPIERGGVSTAELRYRYVFRNSDEFDSRPARLPYRCSG